VVAFEIDLLLAFNDTNHQKQVLELFKIKLISPTTEIVVFLCLMLAA
jgi:hypothetical protein